MAGLLSFNFLKRTGATDVVVPLVDWDASGRAPTMTADAAAARAEGLRLLLEWGPGFDEPRLLAELRKLRPSGTAILIDHLWQCERGGLELDLFSDLDDIRTRPTEDDDPPAASGSTAGQMALYRQRQQMRRATEAAKAKYFGYRHSLRQYAAILYLQHPPGFAIYVRGKRVTPRAIIKDLKHVKMERYNPIAATGPGSRGRQQYKIYIGFAREAPNMDAQGFNLYHRNRLVKPMWEVYKSPSSVGRGVIGVLEVDFVQPSHDKQDFERTDQMNKLEAKLKQLTPQYWKEHGRRVGYQSANPLPKTARELEAEAAADRAAALDEGDGQVPSDLAGSMLFGEREGGRKRKLSCHLQDYHVFHPANSSMAGESSAADHRGNGAHDEASGVSTVEGSSSAANGGVSGVEGSTSTAGTTSSRPGSLHIEAYAVDNDEGALGDEQTDVDTVVTTLDSTFVQARADDTEDEEGGPEAVAEVDEADAASAAVRQALACHERQLEALQAEHAEQLEIIRVAQRRRAEIEDEIIAMQTRGLTELD